MHNYSEKLSIKNLFYLLQVKNYFAWQLDNDLGAQRRDITTDVVFKNKKMNAVAEIRGKNDGIIAGIEEISWYLRRNKIKIEKSSKDGNEIKKGEVVFILKGEIAILLKVERIILNLLQRMSGIATLTHQMVNKIHSSVTLCPTRKTYLGLLDKKAVVIGGGGTHRLGLYDAILVKENHLKNNAIPTVVENIVFSKKRFRFAEIEVENLKQLYILLHEIDKHMKKKILWVIMLDNFSISNIKKALPLLRQRGIKCEISGNIDRNNIQKYTNLGVDIISSGALTHSVKALDFSLKIIG